MTVRHQRFILKLFANTLIACTLSLQIGFAQKYALISSFTMKPVTYADKVTPKDLKLGKFPVLASDYDAFIAELKIVLGYYKELRSELPIGDFDHTIGELHIIGSQTSKAYGYRMSVHLINKINGEKIGMRLLNGEDADIENYQKLERYIKMLEEHRQ